MKIINKIFQPQHDHRMGLKNPILNKIGLSIEFLGIIISVILMSIMYIFYFDFFSLNEIMETFIVVILVIFIYSVPKKLLMKKLNYDLDYNIWIEGFILFTVLSFSSLSFIFVPPLFEKIKIKNTIKRNIHEFDSNQKSDLFLVGIIGPILLIVLTLFCVPFFEYHIIKLFATISSAYVLSNTLLLIFNFDGAKIIGISLDFIFNESITEVGNFMQEPKKLILGILIIFFNASLFSWIVGTPGLFNQLLHLIN